MSATKEMVDSFGRTQEDIRQRRALMEAANKEAKEHWNDPQWRRDFAADLTESILLGFDFETLVGRWIDTETADFDSKIFVEETTGLKAFYMARGGYIEASEMTSEITEVPRDMIGTHVWEFEDKFTTNFAASAQKLRDLSIKRMDAEVNRRVHTVLTEATPSGSPYTLTTPGLSKPGVDAGLAAVRDSSLSGEVTIVGRTPMTDQILNFTGFSNETLEEIRVKGVLGIYRGATVLTLKNYKDEDGQPFLPANELLISATDSGKFGFFGGLLYKEFSELDNWYWHYLARRDTGVIVHHPERVRRFIDSNLPA